MRATAPPPPGGAPGPGSARRAAAIASPGNAERPAGSGRLPAAQPPPRPAEARGAGPLAEGLRRAAWQVDAGWGEKGAPPPSACAPRGCFHRTAAGSTGRPGGGNAPHTAVALCWPGASGGSCSPAGAVRGRRGGGRGGASAGQPHRGPALPRAPPCRGSPSRDREGLRGSASGESRPPPWGGNAAAKEPSGRARGAGRRGRAGRGHSHRRGVARVRRAGSGRGWSDFPLCSRLQWAVPVFAGFSPHGGSFSPSRPCSAMPASEAVLQPSPSKRQKGSVPGEPTARLRFTRLSENASAPSRGSAGAAGYDLYR